MASQTCRRGLLTAIENPIHIRNRQTQFLYLQCSRFSTLGCKQNMNLKAKQAMQAAMPKKGRRTLKIKKDIRPPDPTIGTPEERKAFRTRIVLSNTNANDVSGIQELDNQNMHAEDAVGKVFRIPGSVVDSLRALGAFKRNQGWNNYKKPSFLMTREAWEIGKQMETISSSAELATTLRKVIVGERRSGKSVLLLQVISMALVKGWVVLNIPESRELTDSLFTDYTPLRDSSPLTFMQRSYTARMLSNMVLVNRKALSGIKTTRHTDLQLRASRNATLLQLAELGAEDLDAAWPIFNIIWKELNANGQQEPQSTTTIRKPPILFCADNISYLFSPTQYKTLADDQSLKPVHPFDLLLPKHYIDHLTGAETLVNGGVILGATSSSNFVTCPPLDVGIRLGEARNADAERSLDVNDFWNPLVKIDRRVLDELLNLDVTRLQGLPKEHARGLMEYWALSGLVREHVKDDFIGQKWALSGGGIIGELEKAVVQNLTAGA